MAHNTVPRHPPDATQPSPPAAYEFFHTYEEVKGRRWYAYQQLVGGTTRTALAEELGVSPTTIDNWAAKFKSWWPDIRLGRRASIITVLRDESLETGLETAEALSGAAVKALELFAQWADGLQPETIAGWSPADAARIAKVAKDLLEVADDVSSPDRRRRSGTNSITNNLMIAVDPRSESTATDQLLDLVTAYKIEAQHVALK